MSERITKAGLVEQEASDKNIRIVKPRKDLTGQTFGSLKVLGLSDRLGPRGKRMVPLWECECDCGTITYKATDTLTNKDWSCCADCAAKLAVREMRAAAGYQDGTQVSRIKTVTQESNNASGIRGIYYQKGIYRVRVKFQGKLYNYGSYKTLPEAIRVQEDAKKEIYKRYLESKDDPGTIAQPAISQRKPLDFQIADAEVKQIPSIHSMVKQEITK